MGRDAHDGGVGRHRLHHDSARPDVDVVAHRDVAQDDRTRTCEHALAKGRMALALATEALARHAQGDALVDQAVVAHHSSLADHDAHAVVHDEAPTDTGGGMDIAGIALAHAFVQVTCPEFVPVRPEPVLPAIAPHDAETRRIEKDAAQRRGRGIALEDGVQVLAHERPQGHALRSRRRCNRLLLHAGSHARHP